ncbi:MAG TPA: glycosyl hydrolase [Solirubrobacterales bacterium]
MPRTLTVKSLLALVSLLASFALAGGIPATAAATPIKLGVYYSAQGQVGAPEDAKALDTYASMVGRKPDIVMDYSNPTDPLLTKTEVSNLQARGQTPLVTWQLYQSGWGGPTVSLQDIAAGKYDSHFRRAAAEAKAMPFGEILIRFAHEMNGTWYGWSGNPAAYVEAWRRAVSIFREENVTNVKWVWSPNVDYGNYPFASYFPGDSWVDYVALDGYNWGTTGQGTGKWESLYSAFKSSYDQLTQLSSKPVMIAEVSSSETGGGKAAWIREGFLETIPTAFPRVAAVIWFSRNQEDDWRVDSSASSLEAYREVVASTLYGGTVPPAPKEEEVEINNLEVTPQVTPASASAPTSAPAEPEPTPAPTEPPPTAPAPTVSAPTAPATETTPAESAPLTSKPKRKKRNGRAVHVRGKVTYRLSRPAAAVRLFVRGPGIRGARSEQALTIYNPKRNGRVRLSSITNGRLLKHRRYRVVAIAISTTGNASKPRRDRFKVEPKEKKHRRSHRARAH